jgi:hypothetical protein
MSRVRLNSHPAAKGPSRSILIASMSAVLMFSAYSALAREPQAHRFDSAQAGSRAYHIEVTVIGRGAERGTSAPGILTPENFIVSVAGQRLAVTVSKPVAARHIGKSEFPPHMLVVFTLDHPRPSDEDVLKLLEKALAQGWRVSVARSDGNFTPYCADTAALASALSSVAASPFPQPEKEIAEQAAVATLETFAGRRVLLLGGEDRVCCFKQISADQKQLSARQKGLGAERKEFRAEQKKLAQIYVVDGGLTKHYPVLSPLNSPPNRGGFQVVEPEGSTDEISSQSRNYDDGLVHELKLSDAVADILRDDRNYYDLAFSVPDSNAGSPEIVTLTMHNTHGPLIGANLYTIAPQAADGALVLTRAPDQPNVGLNVVWK